MNPGQRRPLMPSGSAPRLYLPRRYRVACILLLAAITALLNPAFAKDSSPEKINVALLMDSSGSMKKTDPENLRKPAAKLFVSLLGTEDRVSVISFSDTGYPIARLINTDSNVNQEQLFNAIDKISSRGYQTNIYNAIVTAKNLLATDTDPSRRKLIVLMSDGKMDVGDDDKSREQTELLFSKLLPELNAANIELQTIAFTEASDKILLARIARDTGGEFYVAPSDKDLHETFSHIFEQNTKPDMIPLDEGHFYIDDSISEATIIGSKDKADVILSLTTPSGKTYTAKNKPETFKWLESPLFDLITISIPEPGDWHLQASNNKNKAYVITNLQLEIGVDIAEPQQGDTIKIQSWLEKDDQVFTREAILDNLLASAKVIFPDDSIVELSVETESTLDGLGSRSGIFTSHLQLPVQGQYEITLTADSGTFRRSRKIFIRAKPHEHLEDQQKGKATKISAPSPATDHGDAVAENYDNNKILFIAIYVFVSINILLGIIFGSVLIWRKHHK